MAGISSTNVFTGWRFTLPAHITQFCRNNTLDHIKRTVDTPTPPASVAVCLDFLLSCPVIYRTALFNIYLII